jgi:hypothetical protein
LPSEQGIHERIYQKATDAIYPPARVSISPIIDIPTVPGKVIVVIRVDESKDAPHAVEKGTQVYVCERSDNKTDMIKLAHIDRIHYLLERRKRIEERREELRCVAIQRAERLIHPQLTSIIWASVIPLYPWRQVGKPSTCHNFLGRIRPFEDVRRIPGGAMYISRDRIAGPGFEEFTTAETVTCDANGHFLYLRSMVGIKRDHGVAFIGNASEVTERAFDFSSVWTRFSGMLERGREFYQSADIERPGLLSVEIGVKHAKGCRIFDPNTFDAAKPYLDDEYRDEVILILEEFLALEVGSRPLYNRLAFAFDVATLEGQQDGL